MTNWIYCEYQADVVVAVEFEGVEFGIDEKDIRLARFHFFDKFKSISRHQKKMKFITCNIALLVQ